jgi:hypothetical protein
MPSPAPGPQQRGHFERARRETVRYHEELDASAALGQAGTWLAKPHRLMADALEHVSSSKLTGQDLPQWMATAREDALPGISSFAKGPEQDLDAVTNGLTMNWNSGPVEGRVNHIKMVKRQMFGRAGLPLLRKRVLLTTKR